MPCAAPRRSTAASRSGRGESEKPGSPEAVQPQRNARRAVPTPTEGLYPRPGPITRLSGSAMMPRHPRGFRRPKHPMLGFASPLRPTLFGRGEEGSFTLAHLRPLVNRFSCAPSCGTGRPRRTRRARSRDFGHKKSATFLLRHSERRTWRCVVSLRSFFAASGCQGPGRRDSLPRRGAEGPLTQPSKPIDPARRLGERVFVPRTRLPLFRERQPPGTPSEGPPATHRAKRSRTRRMRNTNRFRLRPRLEPV